MEIELAVFNSSTKSKYQPKVRNYRVEFDKIKRIFMRIIEDSGYQRDKDFLIGTQLEEVINFVT